MGFIENYMVFIVCTMATITLVTCNDGVTDDQQSNNDTSTSTSKNNYDHQEFYDTMLKLHNDARVRHGAKNLILSKKISQEAMEYLDGVIGGNVNLTDKCWYYNLYISDNGVQATAETIFNSMYRDGKNYDYKIESEYKFTDSFTQIVWKETKEVGFAFTYKDKTNYFSAIYKPIGNIKGMYVKNVGKPKDPKNNKKFFSCIN